MRSFYVALFFGVVSALSTNVQAGESNCERVLAAAATNQQFTAVLFWKQDDAPTQSLFDGLKSATKEYGEQVTYTAVNVTDPAEAEVVKRLGVSRAPMPLVMVLAPNGAVTAHYRANVTTETLAKAIVTPTMCVCMRALQDGKVVLVCAQPDANAPIPAGVRSFQASPEFQSRTLVVRFASADPAEARFAKDLKLDAREMNGAVAMLAPPGVLVAKFSNSVTPEELAAKLHAAGKCCEDENCKHHKKGAK